MQVQVDCIVVLRCMSNLSRSSPPASITLVAYLLCQIDEIDEIFLEHAPAVYGRAGIFISLFILQLVINNLEHKLNYHEDNAIQVFYLKPYK